MLLCNIVSLVHCNLLQTLGAFCSGFKINVLDRPMEGLGLLAWYSSGGKKIKKDETGNEQKKKKKINQSIKRYYLNIVMNINVLKHWEHSSEQLYKTQNECIFKAVTILQIFWPLVCWKMVVQTVWNPVCHPCLPLDKKKRKKKYL